MELKRFAVMGSGIAAQIANAGYPSAKKPHFNANLMPLDAFNRLLRNQGTLERIDYMRLFGLVALGYLWARMTSSALAHKDEADNNFYTNKLKTAQFFVRRLLPQGQSLLSTIQSGADCMMDFDEDEF